MSPKPNRLFLTFSIVLLAGVAHALAQTPEAVRQMPPPPPAQRVMFEVLDQPGCPLQVTLDPQRTSSLSGQVRLINITKVPVRTYVLVVKADPRDYVWTTFLDRKTLEPGGSKIQGFSVIYPNQNKTEKPGLYIDYVEFADGTTWGKDMFGRSKLVVEYNDGRKIALANLKELLGNTDGTAFFEEIDAQPGFGVGEAVINGNQTLRRSNFNGHGYNDIISGLLRMKTRTDEAKELARKLEQMQGPMP